MLLFDEEQKVTIHCNNPTEIALQLGVIMKVALRTIEDNGEDIQEFMEDVERHMTAAYLLHLAENGHEY